jgi:hypothetical protein
MRARSRRTKKTTKKTMDSSMSFPRSESSSPAVVVVAAAASCASFPSRRFDYNDNTSRCDLSTPSLASPAIAKQKSYILFLFF